MEKKPVILFGTPTKPSARSDQPKIVAAGKARNRIPCTLESLRELDDSASPAVLAKALQAVNGVNLDDHYFDDVVRFGASLQSEHGALAQAELDVVSNDALTAIKANYVDLVQRLEKLDPRRMFDSKPGPLNKMKQYFQGDLTERSFAAEYAEIKALSQSLETSMPLIDSCVDTLSRLSRRYAALSQSLMAHVLASRFIINYINTSLRDDRAMSAHYQSQRDALENRQTSLLATHATLAVGQQTLKVMSHGIDQFGLSGKDFTNEDLPAWYAAFSAALLARRTKFQDAGIVEALVRAHQQLLSKLERPD